MPRIIAIDYGTKRCGIAVSDPLRIIANGLTTVHSKDIISFLENYFSEEETDTIVVGMPKRMSGEETHASAPVKNFVAVLKKKFPGMKIELVDERFTSKIAKRAILETGAKKKDRQKKELVDKISAVIILQSYMESF
ncbi:MAG: Holliday junction resolvase RuvX [Bacteroidetes bacterium]|nr:Holliday junction resolvase RuvX [Bacteroidota bacterium]